MFSYFNIERKIYYFKKKNVYNFKNILKETNIKMKNIFKKKKFYLIIFYIYNYINQIIILKSKKVE